MAWTDFSPSAPELEDFGIRNRIHPLHIEDCRSDEQQAKLGHGDGYLFVVLKIVVLSKDDLITADLDIFVGADYIATVRKSPVAILSRLTENGTVSTRPPDEVLHVFLTMWLIPTCRSLKKSKTESICLKIVLSESRSTRF